MKLLETERLILRSWQSKDIDDLYEYAKTLMWVPWPDGSRILINQYLKKF